MSWTKSVTLWCDGDECEEWVQFEVSTVNMAEIKARKKGWSSSGQGKNRENLCPDCKEDVKSETERSNECVAEECEKDSLPNCAWCWEHATDEMRTEYRRSGTK